MPKDVVFVLTFRLNNWVYKCKRTSKTVGEQEPNRLFMTAECNLLEPDSGRVAILILAVIPKCLCNRAHNDSVP